MNAPDHFLLILQDGGLGGDEAEDDLLVFRYLRQGRKTAGTLIVIFQEEGVDVLPGEDVVRHGVIGAAGEIGGMIVAAADVGIDDHIFGLAFQRQVVDLQQLGLDLLQVDAQGFVALLRGVTHQGTPGAVIQLEIAAARVIELADHILIGLADIPDELRVVRIELPGGFEIGGDDHLLEGLGGGGNGVFCHGILILKLLQEGEILHKGMGFGPDLSDQVGVIQHGQLIMEGYALSGGFVVHTIEAPHEVQVPEGPAELAVGDNVIAKLLLLCHHFGDFTIDNSVQFLPVDLTGLKCCLGVLQGLRPQETSHKIIAEGCFQVAHTSGLLSVIKCYEPDCKPTGEIGKIYLLTGCP